MFILKIMVLVLPGRKIYYSYGRSQEDSHSLAQLLDEDNEMIALPVVSTAKPFVMEDPEITMEEVFREIHPEG